MFPLDLLTLGQADYDVAVAVLTEAEHMRSQRDNGLVKAASEGIAARVVYRLSRAFRRKR